jgi:hypothetical protein
LINEFAYLLERSTDLEISSLLTSAHYVPSIQFLGRTIEALDSEQMNEQVVQFVTSVI